MKEKVTFSYGVTLEVVYCVDGPCLFRRWEKWILHGACITWMLGWAHDMRHDFWWYALRPHDISYILEEEIYKDSAAAALYFTVISRRFVKKTELRMCWGQDIKMEIFLNKLFVSWVYKHKNIRDKWARYHVTKPCIYVSEY